MQDMMQLQSGRTRSPGLLTRKCRSEELRHSRLYSFYRRSLLRCAPSSIEPSLEVTPLSRPGRRNGDAVTDYAGSMVGPDMEAISRSAVIVRGAAVIAQYGISASGSSSATERQSRFVKLKVREK